MSAVRSIRQINPIVMATLGVLAAYWSAASVVLWVDPFDVYGFRKDAQVDLWNTTDDNRYLVDAVAKDPTVDLVMIGSSTAMSFSPRDLRSAYPDARRPYNLSYNAARPADRTIVMNTVVERSQARRLVVWLDWLYAMPERTQNPTFPAYMYDASYYNDLRIVNETALKASLHLIRSHNAFPDLAPRLAQREVRFLQQYASFQSPASRRALAAKVMLYRPTIDRSGVKDCSSLKALNAGLIMPLTKWVAKGRQADIVIPAYSPSFYFDRGARTSGVKLADQLILRRCAVLGTAALPGVRVIALDADTQLTGNLSNYKDPGHLFGERPLGIALDDLEHGDLVLNRFNVDRYLKSLHDRVINFQVSG